MNVIELQDGDHLTLGRCLPIRIDKATFKNIQDHKGNKNEHLEVLTVKLIIDVQPYTDWIKKTLIIFTLSCCLP